MTEFEIEAITADALRREPAAAAPGRALLIANPHSRAGGSEALRPALARLRDEGVDIERIDCAPGLNASQLIQDRRASIDAVIVAGGDGTMNAAARGLVETGLPLGILPLGTANDLARTLDLPTDPVAAAGVILAGETRPIDLGEVNGHLYFNVASLGLSVALARALTPETKRKFGRLAYALAAYRVLLSARPFHATVVSDGESVRVLTLQMAVGNGRYYGGGMTVEESARIDDDRLDFYSLELREVWKLALMAPSFRNGVHGLWQEVRTKRAREFEIRTRRPRSINADGEIVTTTPARFTIRPAAIRVFGRAPTAPAPAP